ncbi:MAG: HAD hydrolase-like protein, partial [Holdemanella sp.]|nr:HAD hydrolase-like protein [Holdemanella sp.]
MSSNKYDLIIFDLDGTLLNTKEGIVSSVKYTIEKMGYKKISYKEI